MNLDLVNKVFNGLKENKLVQNFMEELSNYIENNSKLDNNNYKWNNLNSDDLTLYNTKIISKFKDEMLVSRRNILQEYAKNTKEKGEMYYIYNTSKNEKNSYNLCSCEEKNSHSVITKPIQELPNDAKLGSVLRLKNDEFVLDKESTKEIGQEIEEMIKEKIEKQKEFLESKRTEDHIYEVDEKYLRRIWLYDLNDNSKEGIEEINFPEDLYETAKKGDKFIYQNGEYKKI